MQKVWISLLIIMIGFIAPIVALINIGSNYRYIFLIQIIGLLIMLVSGCILVFINNKDRKRFPYAKLWFILFEVVGFLVILYALVPLYIIFAFRNGINF